jgi:hypothetical protein
MAIKYEFQAGCSCPLQYHSVILEFESQEDMESYENTRDKFELLVTSIKLFFPEKDGCEFNNQIDSDEIVTDKYDYSFAQHKEWTDEDNEDKDEFPILSALKSDDDEKPFSEHTLNYLNELCTYKIYDEVDRNIIVQFKNNNVYTKHLENNFKDILPMLNRYFMEDHQIEKSVDDTLKSEKVNVSELPHFFVKE